MKWIETRREHFLTASGDRDQAAHRAHQAVRRDGTHHARIETIVHAGPRRLSHAGRRHGAPTRSTHLRGPYRVPHYDARGANHRHAQDLRRRLPRRRPAGSRAACSTACSTSAARRLGDGSGRAPPPQPDPARGDAVRHRSLTYRDGVPIVYDRADYPAAFDALARALGLRALAQASRRPGAAARDRSASASAPTWRARASGRSEGADGRPSIRAASVFVDVGVGAQGQAHETTLAQIAARRAPASPLERVVVRGGDTDRVGFGIGTIASRVAAVAGPAVARSAREVAHKARLVGAEMLECAPDDVVVADGHVWWPARRIGAIALGQVARAAVRSRARRARPAAPGLGACVFFYPNSVTWAFGAQACRRRGRPRDGRARAARATPSSTTAAAPINPMVVEGQVHGGTAQGLGARCWRRSFTTTQAQLLTGSLMDYALPARRLLPSHRARPRRVPVRRQRARHQGRGRERRHFAPAR